MHSFDTTRYTFFYKHTYSPDIPLNHLPPSSHRCPPCKPILQHTPKPLPQLCHPWRPQSRRTPLSLQPRTPRLLKHQSDHQSLFNRNRRHFRKYPLERAESVGVAMIYILILWMISSQRIVMRDRFETFLCRTVKRTWFLIDRCLFFVTASSGTCGHSLSGRIASTST